MWFYLILTIAGAVVPWFFNLRQALYGTEPFTVTNFLEAGVANDFVSSITFDFFITATAVFAFMIIEARRLKMKGLVWYIIFTFLIAFAFTCPLFLFNRERALQKIKIG